MDHRLALVCMVCLSMLSAFGELSKCNAASPDGCSDSAALLQGRVQVQETQNDKASIAMNLDWSRGASSWKQARQALGKDDLWSMPNACDPRVLDHSAPLTTLFGITTFWKDIEQRRAALGSTKKALEVHVLGAAYPFEGRSDWSVLASRRPKDVPGVRVVLVLGTPWQADNVPRMKAKELDRSKSLLEEGGEDDENVEDEDDEDDGEDKEDEEDEEIHEDRVPKPEAGHIHEGQASFKCRADDNIMTNDKTWKMEDVCRDHGNGLEVVCIERYYQDAVDELPKPDVVVMFSPGFPQIARRSWDQVLRLLLTEGVPIMVSDVLHGRHTHAGFVHGKAKQVVVKPSGTPWSVKLNNKEDGTTLTAMRAYGAKRLGAFRNPFPVLINESVDRRYKDHILAKCAVLQVFRGRVPSAKPFSVVSKQEMQRRKDIVEDMNWDRIRTGDNKEIKSALMMPSSTAWDRAMWKFYRNQIRRHLARSPELRKKRRRAHDEDDARRWMRHVARLGLIGESRNAVWSFDDWVWILKNVNHMDIF